MRDDRNIKTQTPGCPLKVVLAILLLSLLTPNLASAAFDVVGVYQDKVKQFEAVYFLEDDESWHRDRRVWEIFGQYDRLEIGSYDPPSTLTNTAQGLLFNIRPYKNSQAQLSFFNILSTATVGSTGRERKEALHGARLTLGEWAELSMGAYWLESNGLMDGSFFMELNSPSFFGKSSYVIGKDTTGEGNSLKRFDLRFAYDQYPHADYLEAGLLRYNPSGETHWLSVAKAERLGIHQYRFLSAEIGYSHTEGALAWAKGGLDVMFQSGDDFNLTRRGHFGTGIGFHFIATRVTPAAMKIWQATPTNAPPQDIDGAEFGLNVQVPFKWFLTTVAVVGAAAVEANPDATEAQRMNAREAATDVLASTIREPRDETFIRLSLLLSINSPESYILIPDSSGEERTRLYFTLSLIY